MSKSTVIAEPGKHEITMSRVFDAPRELVYRAYTDPEAVPQWWGQKNSTTIVDRMEAQPGGSWRYIERDAEGNEYAFRGVYHDIVPNEQIIYTFEFEGMRGHVCLSTLRFDDQDGKTKVTEQSVFQSVEDRDGMIASGMEGGANESYDRLEEYLAKA